MHGLPRNGCHDNFAYGTIQCNVAAVLDPSADTNSLETQSLRQLGTFGVPCGHFDCNDCIAAFTNMITNSRLPDGWKTGFFHLIALGVYFELDDHVGCNFQGVWKHGGTGPFPPSPTAPSAPWAYRLSYISYPPQQMYGDGTCRYRLAHSAGASGSDASLYLAPEMQPPANAPASSIVPTAASFFRDGHHFMDAQSQAEYIAQSLYLANRFHLSQVSPALSISFDVAKFFECFSYVDETKQSRSVTVWSEAPPLDTAAYEAYLERYSEESARWKQQMESHGRLTPSQFGAYLPKQPGKCGGLVARFLSDSRQLLPLFPRLNLAILQ